MTKTPKERIESLVLKLHNEFIRDYPQAFADMSKALDMSREEKADCGMAYVAAFSDYLQSWPFGPVTE